MTQRGTDRNIARPVPRGSRVVGDRLGEFEHLALGERVRNLEDEGRPVLELGLQEPAPETAALIGPATQLAGILKAIEEKAPPEGEAAEAAPAAETPVAG